ncbi:MAG TPA: hypothetical protein VHC90_02410 [Bryobacteraceae bacterium]|nr:hypothetical protein [Bryobacteraceae bacterium]
MKSIRLPAALLLLFASSAAAQITLNPSPTRVIGQNSTTLSSLAPNLVEGREFLTPESVVIDPTTSPASLYVSDNGNNRVLGFRNAAAFATGQKADIVIGQTDFATTLPSGPANGTRTTGLASPEGLAVDASGNLWVVDAGNNRVLRFPKPFSQPSTVFPDLVIGQPDFTTGTANQGGITASSLTFNGIQGAITFDTLGNLWVADSGNNRILRFPAAAIAAGKSGIAADLVLGQTTFTVNSETTSPPPATSFTSIFSPAGIAFDSAGRLFVSESVSSQRGRVLVWFPPFTNGQAASRMLGVDQTSPPPPTVSQYEFNQSPTTLFAIGNQIGVADTFNSRLLLFPPVEQWNTNTFYQAAGTVIGQPDFSSGSPNQGSLSPSASSLAQPVGVAFYNGNLYVADTANNRVLLMPQNGSGFGAATAILGQVQADVNSPNLVEGREVDFSRQNNADAGVAIDSTSDVPHLYIADTYNNRILGYYDLRNLQAGQHADIVIGQPDFLHTIANYPDGNSNDHNLAIPTGLAVDVNGNLYVADTGNGRVLRFPAPFANFQPGTPVAVTESADLLLGQISFTTKIGDATSQTMNAPYGLAFTGDHGLLVSDVALNRVLYFAGRSQDFQSSMAATTVFGQSGMTSSGAGSGLNQMNQPHHVAVDTDDRLYVADSGNGRVLVFNRAPAAGNGAFAAITLTSGLKTPRGVDVNPATGDIWVADVSGNQAVRYPNFNALIGSGTYTSNANLTDFAPLAVAEDNWGNVYLADDANRVLIYYPGLSALNAANYWGLNTNPQRPLAPGMITALFSTGSDTQFGAATTSATSIPLPKTLNGLQVLVNNTPSPLFFAGPNQINFEVPSNAPTSGTADIQVVDTATNRVLGDTTVVMDTVAPGIFTQAANGAGDGVIANQDGTLNTPSNPANAGSVVTLYMTGQGYISGMPADGDISNAALSTPYQPLVYMGEQTFVPEQNVLYSGLAPTLVGVWQINVKIPNDVISVQNSQRVQVFVQAGSWVSGGGGLGRPVYIYVKPPK